eukprot:gene5170-10339_t
MKRKDRDSVCFPKGCVLIGFLMIFITGVTINFLTVIPTTRTVPATNQETKFEKPYEKQPEKQEIIHSIPVQSNLRSNSQQRKRIAYAITVTKDGPFIDGSLVLGYSALKVHNTKLGFTSEYDADLVAFVTPKVIAARPILKAFGWKVLERDIPVALSEIQNPEYMKKMKDSGCCGADEFIKLWAYTLTEYHRVVHLDMDSIVYKNMDELYSIEKEMLYTGDYNMQGNSPVPPAQGGFLVVRPSQDRFEELRDIIRKGDYGSKGWGGSKIGNFWGGQTIQGIVPYFYYSVHPGDAQELNRCVYNCMVDNPYRPNTLTCLDGKSTCEDCRLQTFDKVKSAHFTICQKPWTCNLHNNPRNSVLCQQLHNNWFLLRDELEKSWDLNTSYRQLDKAPNKEYLGMCKGWGDRAYLPIPITHKNEK